MTNCGALGGSRASADPLMGGSRFGCGLGVLQLVDEARFQGHCWPTGGWAGFQGSPRYLKSLRYPGAGVSLLVGRAPGPQGLVLTSWWTWLGPGANELGEGFQNGS